jgi:hypothetical protein
MSKQQTAVEWLYNQIPLEWTIKGSAKKILEQAKAIEKQQIEKAWWAGHDERDGNEMIHPSEDCNQYYNQTYKNESE